MMKTKADTCLRTGAICILLLTLSACQGQQNGKQADNAGNSPVVAQVNGHDFHESDIDAEIATLPEQLQYLRDNPELRGKVLQAIMRRYVLSQKARQMHLETTPMVKRRIERAREAILIQALEQARAKNLPSPSDERIKVYYKKHASEFTTPEQIHARHILVSSRKKAEKILRELHKGKDFVALAAAYSLDDSNKSRGGDLNWFPRGAMVKSFEDAAFALKGKDALSKPVKTRFGWHIIQLLGRKPASMQTLDEARGQIVDVLRQQALSNWMEQAMQSAGARVLKAEYRQDEPKTKQGSL